MFERNLCAGISGTFLLIMSKTYAPYFFVKSNATGPYVTAYLSFKRRSNSHVPLFKSCRPLFYSENYTPYSFVKFNVAVAQVTASLCFKKLTIAYCSSDQIMSISGFVRGICTLFLCKIKCRRSLCDCIPFL